jgi:hypothetical protein
LNAEILRDNMLAISGLLSPKMGGPGVFPSQPELSPLKDHGDYEWVESNGEDGYRRGIYTFWRRSAVYPALMNFDAPSREACTVRRIRSNTPLQALTLLNDKTAIKAAAALAQIIQHESNSQNARQRVALGFRRCTCRQPTPEELDMMEQSYHDDISMLERNPNAAAKIAADGHATGDPTDFAAWFLISQALLNLDETLSKE